MAINAAAIIKTINQLMNGEVGTTRTIAATTLDQGHWPWLGRMLRNPVYDVVLESMGRHDASPMSAKGSHRLDDLQVTIELRHDLAAAVQVDKRDEVRGTALYHADLMMQALGYPANLATTSSGTSTGIVSGMLLDMNRDIVSEEWEGRNRGLVTAIQGRAIVRVTQST